MIGVTSSGAIGGDRQLTIYAKRTADALNAESITVFIQVSDIDVDDGFSHLVTHYFSSAPAGNGQLGQSVSRIRPVCGQ